MDSATSSPVDRRRVASYAPTATGARRETPDAGATPTSRPPSVARATGRPYNHRLFVELCHSTDVVVALAVLGTIFIATNVPAGAAGMGEFLLLRLSYGNVALLALFAFAWKQLFVAFGLYDRHQPRSFRAEVPAILAACTGGSAMAFVFPLLSDSGAFAVGHVLLFWPLATLGTVAVRFGLRKTAERAHARSAATRVLIVGSGHLALRLRAEVLGAADVRHEILGFVDTSPDAITPELQPHMIGAIDDLERLLMHNVVDEVLIALPLKSHYQVVHRVIEHCEVAGVKSRYSADVFPTRLARPRVDASDGHPTVEMNVVHDDPRLAIKRALDVVGALVALLVLAPVLVATALAVKASGPGGVLYRQERYGWRKRRFQMLKFRTMVADAEQRQVELEGRNEATGPVFKIGDDPRVTRVGRFLRRTSLDELPQLWNVLRGDMSLVGPRPLPVRDVSRFADPWLMRRFSVVPGCTGLWQISGRSNLGFDEWMRLDLQYIDGWSLALDLRILLGTVPAVIRGVGAK